MGRTAKNCTCRLRLVAVTVVTRHCETAFPESDNLDVAQHTIPPCPWPIRAIPRRLSAD